MKPDVLSVVVPLYNKRTTVRHCLKSILEQNVSDFEVVVVDDGSTDGSGDEVAALNDNRIRLIHQTNQGESAARNRGIAESAGSLIAFLDADDCWLPGFLAAILGLRHSFPQAGLYVTGIGHCWLDGRPDLLVSVRANSGTLITDYFQAVVGGDFVSSSNVAIPKTVVDEVGGFAIGQPWGADRDRWARIAVRHPIACDPRVLAFYFTPPTRNLSGGTAAAPIIPLYTQSILSVLDSGKAPAHLLESLKRYVDWSCLRAADENLATLNRGRLSKLLHAAPGLTRSGRHMLRLYRVLSTCLPLPFLRILRWKGERLLRLFRLAAPNAAVGTGLSREVVRCTHLPVAESGAARTAGT